MLLLNYYLCAWWTVNLSKQCIDWIQIKYCCCIWYVWVTFSITLYSLGCMAAEGGHMHWPDHSRWRRHPVQCPPTVHESHTAHSPWSPEKHGHARQRSPLILVRKRVTVTWFVRNVSSSLVIDLNEAQNSFILAHQLSGKNTIFCPPLNFELILSG